MTSAEKLALTQRSYAAFGRLDSEALIPLYDPDCEWRMGSMAAAFGTEAFRGHDGRRDLVAAISREWTATTRDHRGMGHTRGSSACRLRGPQ